MRLFLLTYLLIYGGMHLYCFLKVRAAFPSMGKGALGVGAFLVFMILGPIFVRMLDRAGSLQAARLLAYLSHTWMAVILWFVVLAAAADLWNLGTWAIATAMSEPVRYALAPKPALCAIAGMTVLAGFWGLCEASNVRLKRIALKSERLPAGSEPLRVAQISDVHLSLIVRKRSLARILKRIQEARPDLLVCTGDLAETGPANLRTEARMLADLRIPLGKFAVTGNHEYYLGLDKSREFHEAAGFLLLRGESRPVGDHLLVAGVDDPAGLRTRRPQPCFHDEDSVLPGRDRGRFTILLKHQPRVKDRSVGRFDLQLSGHTHGGQIFPFNVVVHLFHRLRPGLHRLPDGSAVYVSRGSGTWGPPLRLLSPPEVTLFTIEPSRP